MGSREGNLTGLAGEFRIMSELLLRGHNPAKSYLNDGPDIVLENGKRIEAKCVHKLHDGNGRYLYHFSFRGGRDNKFQHLEQCDFIICWCIDENIFYIVPIDAVRLGEGMKQTLTIYSAPKTSRYLQYKEAWDLLK